MYCLVTILTSPLYLFKVFLHTDRTGQLCKPHKMKGTAVTCAVWTLWGKPYLTVALLVLVTAKTDHCVATTRTCSCRPEKIECLFLGPLSFQILIQPTLLLSDLTIPRQYTPVFMCRFVCDCVNVT